MEGWYWNQAAVHIIPIYLKEVNKQNINKYKITTNGYKQVFTHLDM